MQNGEQQPYSDQPYEPTRSRSDQPPQQPYRQQQPGYPQQPYPYETQAPMPYQVPKPPKKHRGRNIALAIVGGFLALIVIGAVASGGKSGGSTAASSPTKSVTATTQAAQAPAASDSATATQYTTTQAPAPAKAVVFHLKGSGEESSTKTFTVQQSDYSIAYTYDCSNFGDSGNFILDEMQSGNSGFDTSIANDLGNKGGNTDYMHDGPAANIYLSVSSECAWTVTVTDGDTGQ